jgi:DUF3037 family protein
MSGLKKFDYFYLRYAPYIAMDDYVTFGVIMLENPHGFAGVRFMKNKQRILCSFPDTDLDYFNFLERDINEHLAQGERRDELLAKLFDCLGNAVQFSPYRECLAEDGNAAIELLAHNAIDFPIPAGERKPSAHRRIQHKIQDAFEAAGIWGLVTKNVTVADYSFPGDPLKIDASYQRDGAVKMFKALPLKANVLEAKGLSFSYPKLVEGIAKKVKATSVLTAIVEDDLDRNNPNIGFALGILEGVGIEIAVTAELPIIAEKARVELMA